MILQILTHARQVSDQRDADIVQQRPGTDTGQLQYLRGADCPGRQDHLSSGPRLVWLTASQVFHPHRPAALEHDPRGMRPGQHRQVRARSRRAQEALGRAPAETLVSGLLEVSDAFLACAVVVLVERYAYLGGGLDEVIGDRSA